jgi:serine/threonine protein kinase
MTATRLGHYRILEKIGAGGMGEVYRARDERLQRDVAVKVLPASSFSDASSRARLLREARAAAVLNHPNICTIHEVGEADGQAYIVMELLEGELLSSRLTHGAMAPAEVVRYGLQLAEALTHAHEREVIHRDLKSSNVMITVDGRLKMLDFGLAKRFGGEEVSEVPTGVQLTKPGSLLGTLAYMAPDQLRGVPADERSDIWALGVVLYEMAAGSRPFQGQTNFELSSAILIQPPPPLPWSVPEELRAMIQRCLAKEPGRRYQRAAEVRAVLDALQFGLGPG